MSVLVTGAPVTLTSTGASIASASVGVAGTSYSVATNGNGFAHVEFVLTCAFATAPTENSTVDLYLRPLDIDGALDAEVPESGATNFKGNWFAGCFVLNNVTTTQVMTLRTFDVPRLFEAYLHNNGGNTMSANWKLVAIPTAYKAAP